MQPASWSEDVDCEQKDLRGDNCFRRYILRGFCIKTLPSQQLMLDKRGTNGIINKNLLFPAQLDIETSFFFVQSKSDQIK